MAGAAMFFGGALGFSSFWTMPCCLHGCPETFKRAIHPMKDDSTTKKIARVADETLQIVGKIFGSIAGMVMAVQMVSGATSLGFCGSVLAGATLATPYVLIGVSCFVLGALARIHGGPSYVEPSATSGEVSTGCSGSGFAVGEPREIGVDKGKEGQKGSVNVGGREGELGAGITEADALEKVTDEEEVSEKEPAAQVVEEEAVAELAVAKEPVEHEAVAETAVAKEPVEHEAAAETVVAKEPVEQEAVAETAVVKEPVEHEAAAETAVAKEPVEQQAVAEPAVAKEAVEHEAVAETAVVKEPVEQEAVAEPAVAKEPVEHEAVAETAVAKEPVEHEAVAETAVMKEPVTESKNVIGFEAGHPKPGSKERKKTPKTN